MKYFWLVLFLLLAPVQVSALDVDLDSNTALDEAYGGTNTTSLAAAIEALTEIDLSAVIVTLPSLTGVLDLGGLDSLEIPNSATPTLDAAGEIALDTTIAGFTGGAVRYYNGTAIKQFIDMTSTTAEACTDDQVVAYDAAADVWYCKDDATGSGSLGSNLSSTTDDITSDNGTILLDGGGSYEDLDINFTTANTVTLSSSTGATNIHAPGIALTGGVYTISTASSCTIGTDCDSTKTNVAYGGIVYVTGAATVTLPAIGYGMSITVITVGAVAVSVDTNANDLMYLDGVALNDGDKATNRSTTGDLIHCNYYSAAGWYCASGSTTGDQWTDGGP